MKWTNISDVFSLCYLRNMLEIVISSCVLSRREMSKMERFTAPLDENKNKNVLLAVLD